MEDLISGEGAAWLMGAAGTLIGGTLVSVARSIKDLVTRVSSAVAKFDQNIANAEGHRKRELAHWEREEAFFRRTIGANTGPQTVVGDRTPIEGIDTQADTAELGSSG